MHPSLRLQNLSHLPFSLRRLATPALKGSLKDLKQLVRLVEASSNEETFGHCLPVFYTILDPTGIPDLLDTELWNTAAPCANVALEALRGPASVVFVSPLSGGPALWRRVWAWLIFFAALDDSALWSTKLLYIMERFSSDACTTAVISETPGVRAMVMRGWADLFTSPDPPHHPGFRFIRKFLSNSMLANEPAHLAEVLEGSDGPAGLASLIVRYIGILVPGRRRVMHRANMSFFDAILTFVWQLQETEEIGSALISGGVLKFLSSAACAVSEYTDSDTDSIEHAVLRQPMLAFFEVLDCFLDISPSSDRIKEALAAGLLPTIIRTAIICKDIDIQGTALWRILDARLPESTVFSSVLSQLDPLLEVVETIAAATEFTELPIHSRWRSFHTLASVRGCFMEEKRLEADPAKKACDNMQCGIIREKSQFRRCCNCQRVYYCSTDCQKADWEMGDHRGVCKSMRRFRLTQPHLNLRDLAFMRGLLHRDAALFTKLSGSHFATVLSRMQENPGELLVTVFDYSRGGVTCIVRTLGEERSDDLEADIDWEQHVDRANRSGGRMSLHIMRIPDGKRIRRWMLPLRFDSSALHDGLLGILKTLPPDVEDWQLQEVKTEVERLLEANEDVLEIHS
ncbi:hypothetical protein C8R46DRAFT_1362601 [Mycena filopes]|nr:hypothetical protein C8R46DRAFT_1362601 [Mycena filopes]